MKRIIVLLALCAMGIGAAQAAPMQSCADQAAAKKLSGAAKTSFVDKCMRTQNQASPMARCEQAAKEKKLSGAAKTSFINKCVKDAGGSGMSGMGNHCEQSAADKKLVGAAKQSFMQKCMKDMKGS